MQYGFYTHCAHNENVSLFPCFKAAFGINVIAEIFIINALKSTFGQKGFPR